MARAPASLNLAYSALVALLPEEDKRIVCRRGTYCDSWCALFQTVKKFLKKHGKDKGNHPEREIGKKSDSGVNKKAKDADDDHNVASTVEAVINFLLNGDELVHHIVSQGSSVAKYFLLDLIYYCDKHGVSLIRKRKLVSISQQKILILAVDKIVVPCQQGEMDAVHAQTRLKACEALIHLVKRADTAERSSDSRCGYKIHTNTTATGIPGLRHKECYLVDVAAMTRLCVRRTLPLSSKHSIRYKVWSLAGCTYLCHILSPNLSPECQKK